MSYDVMEKYNLDKWDVMIALSSGTLTAMLDVFLVKDISLTEAHKWGKKETDEFVKYVARKNGYSEKNGDLAGAIRFLEGKHKIAADQLTNEFGGGKQHHLRDFAHHPTLTGLIFSILTQFTGQGYGTDVHGNFIQVPLPDQTLLGKTFVEKIYMGFVTWGLHMVSDIAGSSSSVAMGKEGTGLPGPLMSFFKEISAIPGIKSLAGKNEKEHYEFSVYCSKLFNGTLLGEHDENGNIIKEGELKFDLRTEIGIVHESINNKQYLPVLLNEAIVRGFYAIRGFCNEVQEKDVITFENLKQLDYKKILPFNNRRITHMLAISSTMFSVVDISGAVTKAALKNKDNKAGFALDVFQGINYFGLGRFALSATGEMSIAGQEIQKKLIEAADSEFAKVASKALAITKIGTPVGFVSASVGVYQEISDAMKELQLSKEERLFVEAECQKSIEVIRAYQMEMNAMVEEYLTNHMETFAHGFDKMDQAIKANDINQFIEGNNVIQAFLGYDVLYKTQDEFDEMMLSEDCLVF